MQSVEYLRDECTFVDFEKLQEFVEMMSALDAADIEDHKLEMNKT